MVQASLILLLGLGFAYVQGCTVKDDVENLISVGYFTDEKGTAVDKIEVKMKDGGKFVNLMEGSCSGRDKRSKEVDVKYRVC